MNLIIDNCHFEKIKENLFINRDTFDNEIYKLITKFGNIKCIQLPYLSRAERHILHRYERRDICFYSFGESDGEFSKMQIVMNTPYLSSLKRKYKKESEIESLLNNFKNVLITDISEIIDERFSNFKI